MNKDLYGAWMFPRKTLRVHSARERERELSDWTGASCLCEISLAFCSLFTMPYKRRGHRLHCTVTTQLIHGLVSSQLGKLDHSLCVAIDSYPQTLMEKRQLIKAGQQKERCPWFAKFSARDLSPENLSFLTGMKSRVAWNLARRSC